MANRTKSPPPAESLRESVYQLSSEMEEPLRHALQMVRLIGLVDPQDDEDMEAVGLVAHEAATKLHTVSSRLRDLFAACALP
ncbi:MAG TPA: hypothetical protein VG889_11725 [Rhizomicrobium sp.]|nr:hypothetical protein [Rhizomicrobium sp.]